MSGWRRFGGAALFVSAAAINASSASADEPIRLKDRDDRKRDAAAAHHSLALATRSRHASDRGAAFHAAAASEAADKSRPASDPYSAGFIPVLDEAYEEPDYEALTPTGVSGVLNASLIYDRFENGSIEVGEDEFESLSLNLNPHLSLGGMSGVFVETEARLVSERSQFTEIGFSQTENETRWERGFTRLVKDFPQSAVRATLGDHFILTDNFQRSASTIGFTVERAYYQLQPLRSVYSSGRRAFVLERPAQAEIYVGDELFRETRLDPGRYEFGDFPVELGANQVELVLRDTTGRVQRIDFLAVDAPRLLEPGLLDFSATLGAESRFERDGPDYDFDRPVFSGYANYGLNQRTTIGADAQADRDAGQIGASLRRGYGFGAVALSAAVSHSDTLGSGHALRAGFETGSGERWPAIQAEASWYSPEFSSIGAGRFPNDQELEVFVAGFKNFGENISVTFGGDWQRLRNEDGFYPDSGARVDFWSVYVSPNWSITDDLNLDLTLNAGQDGNRDKTAVEAFVSLNYRFGVNKSANSSYDTRQRFSRLTLSREPVLSNNDWSARASFENLAGGRSEQVSSVDADVFHDRFTGYASHIETLNTSVPEAHFRSTTAQVDIAIAYADGVAALGPPVSGSGFAIADNSDQESTDIVYVDRFGANDYRARTGGLGPALITDLTPYSNEGVELSVEEAGKAAGEGDELNDAEPHYLTLYTPYYGGVVVRPPDRSQAEAVPEDTMAGAENREEAYGPAQSDETAAP